MTSVVFLVGLVAALLEGEHALTIEEYFHVMQK